MGFDRGRMSTAVGPVEVAIKDRDCDDGRMDWKREAMVGQESL